MSGAATESRPMRCVCAPSNRTRFFYLHGPVHQKSGANAPIMAGATQQNPPLGAHNLIRIAQNAKRRNRRAARATPSSLPSKPFDENLRHSARAAHPPMVRNKAAHSVSGHKPKSEYRRHKFNELDHENLPSLGGLESRCSATKMRRSYSEECPDFMHCVETSAIQLHKQNPLQLTGNRRQPRTTGPSNFVRK
jgi:hypothetical protein